MVRNVLGTVLALIGATAAVWSPFRAWYDGRHGRDYRLGELFSGGGVTDSGAQLFGSLFLPLACAALVTLVGLLLRSRLLVALAGVVVLGFAVLWMVRQGQKEGSLSVSGDGSGLGLGVLAALGGGVLLLLAAALMAGRPRVAGPAYDDTGAPEPRRRPGRRARPAGRHAHGHRDDPDRNRPFWEQRPQDTPENTPGDAPGRPPEEPRDR
ncbi:hypothetical protein [Streptomyces sp. NPDC023327]|uniref:hypothetical protein n=1 Tax=Streptomyces sp. NPDC023327 TaxID=3157088 RepID=UPI0033CF5C79